MPIIIAKIDKTVSIKEDRFISLFEVSGVEPENIPPKKPTGISARIPKIIPPNI